MDAENINCQGLALMPLRLTYPLAQKNEVTPIIFLFNYGPVFFIVHTCNQF